jgi:hypothetical protein
MHRQQSASAMSRLVSGAAALCVLLAPAISWAQTTPTIIQIPATGAPPTPPGLTVKCFLGPAVPSKPSPICPVIQYRGLYTWPLSSNSPRDTFNFATYDGQAHLIRNVEKHGSQNPYAITIDPVTQTVAVFGTGGRKVELTWADLPHAGPSDAVYRWVAASSPPPSAVLSPNFDRRAVCRARDDLGLWAGWWNGAACSGFYGSQERLASRDLQFLTLVSGTADWVSGASIEHNVVGPLPANTVDAGATYAGYRQVLCSYAGHVGWIYHDQCVQSRQTVVDVGPLILVGAVQ